MEKGRTESRSFQSFNPSLVPALGSRALSPHPQTSSLRSPPSPALYRILMQVKPKALNPLRKKNPSSALCLSLPVLFFSPHFFLFMLSPQAQNLSGSSFPSELGAYLHCPLDISLHEQSSEGDARARRRQPCWKFGQIQPWPLTGRQVPPCPSGH